MRGLARTVNATNVKSAELQGDVQLPAVQAELGKCELAGAGLIDRQQVSLVYDVTENRFVVWGNEVESRTLAHPVAGLDKPQAVLSFMGLPFGEYGVVRTALGVE